MERVVDIETEGLFLAVHRGFLTVNEGATEKGRIPLDDIGALIVHAHGTTWSNTVMVRLAERAIPIVVCGPDHAPVSCVWPIEGHHAQAGRMRAQIAAPRPLQKQMWKQIVSAKILMQGQILAMAGHQDGAFAFLAGKVRSGDPDNTEAQAARRYWKALFGKDFSRDRNGGGANSFLNYGYAVLRALVSRAICAAGLHPSIGIFHSNRGNAFALADDLMEPYRPLVDMIVLGLLRRGPGEMSTEAKHVLAGISTVDLEDRVGATSPLFVHVQRFVHSVAVAFETGSPVLELKARLRGGTLPVEKRDDDQT